MVRKLTPAALALAVLLVGCGTGEPPGEHVSGKDIDKQRQSGMTPEELARQPKVGNGPGPNGAPGPGGKR